MNSDGIIGKRIAREIDELREQSQLAHARISGRHKSFVERLPGAGIRSAAEAERLLEAVQREFARRLDRLAPAFREYAANGKKLELNSRDSPEPRRLFISARATPRMWACSARF